MKQKRNFSKGFFVTLVALAALVFCAFSAGATLSSSSDKDTADTSAIYTDEILSQAGIVLGDSDKVIRVDSDGAVSLTIVRAFEVEVIYRGESFNTKVAGGTVAEAINAAGFTLSGAEEVAPSLDTQVCEGMTIEITADSYATVCVDGETRDIATKAKTVDALLSEQGITVGKDDIINVDYSDEIYDGIEIVINRVEYKEEVKTESVDYGFVTKETDDMYLGVTMIDTYGVEGEKELTYKCKYIDGELVDTELINEEITVEPVDQVELVGTYEEPVYEEPEYDYSYDDDYWDNLYTPGSGGTFTDHNGDKVSYTQVYTGSATAYYAAEGSYTATGTPVYKGGVAVNPDLIPYGTQLYIVSSDGSFVYGYATAVDTGGALMSGEALVDVFYPTYDECVIWGRRDVTVYILG